MLILLGTVAFLVYTLAFLAEAVARSGKSDYSPGGPDRPSPKSSVPTVLMNLSGHSKKGSIVQETLDIIGLVVPWSPALLSQYRMRTGGEKRSVFHVLETWSA